MFISQARKGLLDHFENSVILRQLAEGPLKHIRSYNVCYVNGYRFHTMSHAADKTADNSGVCVKSDQHSLDEDDFYGHLQEIIEVEYPGMPIKRVTLFRCHWYDPTTTGYGHGTKVHKRYKLVDIHHGRSYRNYDPFVLASQASQVYYLSYPNTRQNTIQWKAVCKVKPNKFIIPTQKDSMESAFQDEDGEAIAIEEDVSNESLCDSSGLLQQVEDINIADQDDDEDVDVELVLSEDEEDDDVEDNYSDDD